MMKFLNWFSNQDVLTKYVLLIILAMFITFLFFAFTVLFGGCSCHQISTQYYPVGQVIYKAVYPAGWVQGYGPIHGSQSIHIRRVYRPESYYFILQTPTGDIWMKVIHSEDEFHGTPLRTIISCRGARQLQTKGGSNS